MTIDTLQDLLDGQEHRCLRCREKLDLGQAVMASLRLALGGSPEHSAPPTRVLVCRPCAVAIVGERAATPPCPRCSGPTVTRKGFWTCLAEGCASLRLLGRAATPEEIVDHGWGE